MSTEFLLEASKYFKPGAPIDKYSLFAGRNEQIQDVLNAVLQQGQHVIIYGERGVGKTSLSNILDELLSKNSSPQGNIVYAKVNCDSNDNFQKLWTKVLREIKIQIEKPQVGFGAQSSIIQTDLGQFVTSNVSPEDLRILMQSFGRKVIIVIDELDRIEDKNTTVLLTDTIKTFSDHGVDTTLILVGVADSVDSLISEHRSIERSLVQVHMPRMSARELEEILEKAYHSLGIKCSNIIKNKIVKLSEGLPHYTHLLGLYAATNTNENNRQEINDDDISSAIKVALKKAQQSILHAYHRATTSPRKDNLYERVLLACAMAKTDELGYFAAADARAPLSLIMKKDYDIPAFARHLKDFCEEKRGPILQKTGTVRRQRYRFINPLFQPFVVMHGLDKGLISDIDLSSL